MGSAEAGTGAAEARGQSAAAAGVATVEDVLGGMAEAGEAACATGKVAAGAEEVAARVVGGGGGGGGGVGSWAVSVGGGGGVASAGVPAGGGEEEIEVAEAVQDVSACCCAEEVVVAAAAAAAVAAREGQAVLCERQSRRWHSLLQYRTLWQPARRARAQRSEQARLKRQR